MPVSVAPDLENGGTVKETIMNTRIYSHTFTRRLFQVLLLVAILLALLIPSLQPVGGRIPNEQPEFFSDSDAWFVYQRAPHMQDIPPDARRHAWETATVSQQGYAVGAAVPV